MAHQGHEDHHDQAESITVDAGLPSLNPPAGSPADENLGQALTRITQEHQVAKTELRRMEDALRESTQRYKMLVERTTDVVYMINRQGFFVYANPATRRLTGYEQQSIVGRHFTELIVPEWRAKVRDFYREQLASEETLETVLDFPIVTCCGETRWVEQVVSPIFDNEKIVGFQSIVHDITERKQHERTLQEAEHRYHALFEQAHDAVFILDLNGNHLQANRRASEMLGYSPEEIQHLSFRELSLETTESENIMERLMQGEHISMYERVFRRKDGNQIVVEINVELVRTADGSPLHIQSVVRDITGRKRTEDAILESEVHLRHLKKRVEAILNNNSDAIIVAYPDGTFQQANPAFYGLLGYQPDEIYGDPLTILVEPDYIEVLTRQLDKLLETHNPEQVELVIRRKDGTTFPAEAAISSIYSSKEGEGILGIICSVRDISRRKQMEEELRQALAQERELGDLKTRFVSMASHEFRTPLATIQTTSDALRHYYDRMNDGDREKRFTKIDAQIRHMTMMLDDVLTLGRFQTGNMDFSPVQTAVHPFFLDIIDDMTATDPAQHTIIYTCADENLEAVVDRKLLRQITVNILTNAIKYSAAGTTICFDVTEAQGMIVMTFQDEGIGIPEEDQKHLFEAFHRAQNARNQSGTGLGLAITQHGVELHGGTITFQSTVDVGTTFTVNLPLEPNIEG